MYDTHVLDAAARRRAERLEAERRVTLQRVVAALESQGSRMGLREAYVVVSSPERGSGWRTRTWMSPSRAGTLWRS